MVAFYTERKVITTVVIRPLDDRTHILLDIRLLIWGFDKSCTIVVFISSQPTKVF